MNQIQSLLEKIYNNGNSLYFYIILGGLALILILIFILVSIKPKAKEDIKEIKTESEEPNKVPAPIVSEHNNINEMEDTLVMKPIINEPVNIEPNSEQPIINQEPVPNNNFSPVYLDIKPVNQPATLEPTLEPKLEPVLATKPEAETPIINQKPEIKIESVYNPESEIKPELDTTITKPEIKLEQVPNFEPKENINDSELSINPNIFSPNNKLDENKEIGIPLIKEDSINAFDIKVNEPVTNSKPEEIKQQNENIINEPSKNESDYNQEIINHEEIKPVLIDDEKIVTVSDLHQAEDNQLRENDMKKDQPIVLSVDEIRAKLNQLSNSNQSNSAPDHDLDDLLKQIGIENNNISQIKDEESILLGK